MNVLQFSTINHVSNTYNLAFFFFFSLQELNWGKKAPRFSLFMKHMQILRSSSDVPGSGVQSASLGERYFFLL